MSDTTEREDDAYYNFVTAFRREHKRFPRAEEAWQARAALPQPAAGGAVGEAEGFSAVELDLKERARKSEIMHDGRQYVLGQVLCGALFEMRNAMRHARIDELTLTVAIKENDALRAAAASQRLTAEEWRRDALESAAQIAERYPTDGKSIASDIRAISSVPTTAAPDESRDIEMIEYAIDNRMLSAEQILAAFNESRKR